MLAFKGDWQLPYFSLKKKMYKIEKNITNGFELHPPDFNLDANDLKAY